MDLDLDLDPLPHLNLHGFALQRHARVIDGPVEAIDEVVS